MSIKKFKNHLQNQDPEYLIDELVTLYKTFEVVREFYIQQLEPSDTPKVMEKYKLILEKQFCPKSAKWDFPELNYSVARKAISDFKKANSNPVAIIDLQLTYVEYGVECTLEYGDINRRFYNSMESMFRKTLKDMEEHGVLDLFEKRCLAIQQKTRDLGWGFGNAVTELYEEYFS
ncbi:Uncharacterized protein PHSC3_000643 [Chlamydiales bacterium STE3]|nr:Uncharacterized protein PHSC3_000643 [Chlamydiales bacterium STE3]